MDFREINFTKKFVKIISRKKFVKMISRKKGKVFRVFAHCVFGKDFEGSYSLAVAQGRRLYCRSRNNILLY